MPPEIDPNAAPDSQPAPAPDSAASPAPPAASPEAKDTPPEGLAADTDQTAEERTELFNAFSKAIDEAPQPDVPSTAEGTTVALTSKEPGEETGEAEPGSDPTGQELQQDPDELTEAEMAALAPRTQARIRSLIDSRAGLQEQFNQFAGQTQQFMGEFERVGLGPEEIKQLVNYADAMKRGDRVAVESFLEAQNNYVSQRFGSSVGGADPLQHFPDIREKVENLEISEELALQMASERADLQRLQQGQREQQTSQAQAYAQQQQQGMYQNALQGIANQEAAWRKSDPDFGSLEAPLVKFAQENLHRLPVTEWVPAMEAQYQVMKEAQKAWGVGQRGKPTPNPLRPGNIGGRPAAGGENPGMAEAVFGPMGMEPPTGDA